jgi:hypothetical protein
VLRGLDYGLISAAPDEMLMEKYPDYIYDDSILNDAEYVLNKEVFTLATFLDVIWYTARGGRTTTFDEYGNFSGYTDGGNFVISTLGGKDWKVMQYAYPYV